MIIEEKFDEKERPIYRKYSRGVEECISYEEDEHGNLSMHTEFSDGDVTDAIHYKDSGEVHVTNGEHKNICKFNDEGNIVYYKDNDGTEVVYEWDEQGRFTHSRVSNGYERWAEYKDGKVREWDNKGNSVSHLL